MIYVLSGPGNKFDYITALVRGVPNTVIWEKRQKRREFCETVARVLYKPATKVAKPLTWVEIWTGLQFEGYNPTLQ